MADKFHTLDRQEKEEVAGQVTRYKEYQSLIYNGLYYRLSNPYEENLSVWSFVSKDQAEVLVQGIVFRASSNSLRPRIRLAGLAADDSYMVPGEERVYTGRALMSGGILLPDIKGDDVSIEFTLKKAGYSEGSPKL